MDLKIQERVDIATEDWLHFRIDMVLYKGTDAVCVVDTKYKAKEHILTEDVAQVAAYAQSKNCEKAFLVYPSSDTQPVTARIGNVRVQTLLFSLQGDLEEAGQSFLRQLLGKSDVS
jgi:5-methylcytosine-specific restriction enzyme subunit McrC